MRRQHPTTSQAMLYNKTPLGTSRARYPVYAPTFFVCSSPLALPTHHAQTMSNMTTSEASRETSNPSTAEGVARIANEDIVKLVLNIQQREPYILCLPYSSSVSALCDICFNRHNVIAPLPSSTTPSPNPSLFSDSNSSRYGNKPAYLT
jgi:hypothetical protein